MNLIDLVGSISDLLFFSGIFNSSGNTDKLNKMREETLWVSLLAWDRHKVNFQGQ